MSIASSLLLVEKHLLAASADLKIDDTKAQQEIAEALKLIQTEKISNAVDVTPVRSRNDLPAFEDNEVVEWINSSFFKPDTDHHHGAPRETDGMTAVQKWKWAFRKITVSSRVIRIFSSSLSSPRTNTAYMDLQSTLERISVPEVSSALSKLPLWDFDVFKFGAIVGGNVIPVLGMHVARQMRLLKSFNIQETVFHSLLNAIQDNYLDTNYHNKYHAADVMISSYWLIAYDAPKIELDDIDRLSLIIASLMHDLKHPGRNNAFMINSESDLALTYNDISVLENYHLSEFFKLLRQPNLNIFKALRKHQYLEIRRKIISMVLATDMSKHFNLSKAASSHLTDEFDATTNEVIVERKQFFMDMIVHASDLSSPVKGLETSTVWAHRIWEEFFAQGDQEKQLGLEISPMMNREATHQTMAKSQRGFIDYVVQPLFKLVESVVPHVSIVLNHAENNRKYWDDEASKE